MQRFSNPLSSTTLTTHTIGKDRGLGEDEESEGKERGEAGKDWRREGLACKSPLLLERGFHCFAVCVIESVGGGGDSDSSAQPPAALVFSPGKLGSQICFASCQGKREREISFFFLLFFPLFGCS